MEGVENLGNKHLKLVDYMGWRSWIHFCGTFFAGSSHKSVPLFCSHCQLIAALDIAFHIFNKILHVGRFMQEVVEERTDRGTERLSTCLASLGLESLTRFFLQRHQPAVEV
jgi:hypothetical protein